jgi:uncharacterized membrane protein
MEARRTRILDVVVAAGLSAVVAAAAGVHLGRTSLWFDEALSWSISSHGFGGLFRAYTGDVAGNAIFAPLYFLALHGWIEAFGTSEAALRSLSAVFAIASIPLFLALCRCLLRPAVAYVVTALLAASPFFLDYAREARMYSLAVLLVITMSYCFVRTIEAPASRWWLGYGFLAGLAVYAHVFVAFVVLAQLLSLAFLPRPVQWRPIGRAASIAAALAAPLAVSLVTKSGGGLDWVSALSREQIHTFLQTLTGASRRASAVVVLVVGLAGTIVCYCTWKQHRERLWRVGFPLLWFVVPVVGTAAVSVVKPLFVDRYLIVVLPGFLLTVGVVLDSLVGWRRWLVPLVAGLLVAVSYPGLDRVWDAQAVFEDWRKAVAYLDSHYEDRDEVVVGEDAFASTAYYALRSPQLGRMHPVDPPIEWDSGLTHHRRTPFTLADQRTWIVVRASNGLDQPWETPGRDRFRREVARNPHVHRVHHTENVVIYRYDPPATGL